MKVSFPFIIFFLVMIVGVFVSKTISFGQAFVSGSSGVLMLNPNAGSTQLKTSLKRGAFIGPHFFGDSIAYKMNQLEQTYVYYQPGTGAYAVEQKIIIKPDIYKKIKSLERHYISLVKKNDALLEESTLKLSNNLKLALKLMNYDTKNVERDLKRIRKPAEIQSYFSKIRFNGY
jgi:hypothetical protein